MKKNVLSVSLFILFLTIVACKTEPVFPFEGSLPSQEIVFRVDNPRSSGNNDLGSIAFITSEGKDRKVYSFFINSASPKERVSVAQFPQWSREGDMLGFSVGDAPPNIRLVDSDGRMYGKNCTDLSWISCFDGNGNIVSRIERWNRIYEEYEDVIENRGTVIAQYNLKTCKIVDTFIIPYDYLEWSIEWIDLMGNQIFVANIYELGTNDLGNILIYFIDSGDIQIFPGLYPSLSDDGTLLAYYKRNGELTIRNIDTKNEVVLLDLIDIWNSTEVDYLYPVGWSSDNKWVVYNTSEGKIYKMNIDSKEAIYLTDGWAPDWR